MDHETTKRREKASEALNESIEVLKKKNGKVKEKFNGCCKIKKESLVKDLEKISEELDKKLNGDYECQT